MIQVIHKCVIVSGSAVVGGTNAPFSSNFRHLLLTSMACERTKRERAF